MYEKIKNAAKILDGVAHRTPVLTSTLLNEKTGNSIFLKGENFQRGGAFKFRGAYHAMKMLTPEEKEKGVIVYSSGNHGMATALAGKLQDVPVTVVMPEDAPSVKIDATKAYGANVLYYNRFEESREEKVEKLKEKHGYTIIPPYDHENILAGQGTVAKELIEDAGELDYVFVPCGGGGLLSGCSVSTKALLPNSKVIGVEPEVANDATKSFQTGKLQRIDSPNSIADGLNTPSLGEVTFPLIRQHVDDYVNVSEDEILSTMYYLWTRLKIVVEPSGAVALAAVFHGKVPVQNKRIGVVLSGGNVDVKAAGSLFKDVDVE
jgi:threonine dehydratase